MVWFHLCLYSLVLQTAEKGSKLNHPEDYEEFNHQLDKKIRKKAAHKRGKLVLQTQGKSSTTPFSSSTSSTSSTVTSLSSSLSFPSHKRTLEETNTVSPPSKKARVQNSDDYNDDHTAFKPFPRVLKKTEVPIYEKAYEAAYKIHGNHTQAAEIAWDTTVNELGLFDQDS